MGKLTGKVALITGASKGIGEGIARVYARHGAKLVLVARSKSVEKLASDLKKQGFEATAMQADVSDPDSICGCVKNAVEKYGQMDILVNNAGVCKLGNFLDMSDEDRDYHIDINIKGVWNTTKAVLPYMKSRKSGKIIVMSSVTGDMVADPGEVAYAMTKAALVGFTKSLAVETAPFNITVNAICPGYVITPMARSIAKQSDSSNPDSVLQGIAGAVPMKRLADPQEVGELAAFLGCGESSYITGTQIVIDGGSTLPETVSVGV